MNPAEKLYEKIWTDQATSEAYKGGNHRIDLAIEVVVPGRRLLDLGCSDGVLAQQLKGRFSETHGVDISAAALAAAAGRGIQTHQLNVDQERLPFEDGYFDTVTCLDLIEHVFEPRVLVAEIRRVLGPGGAVYIAFPNMRYIIRIKELFSGRFPKTSGDLEYSYDGGHLHYYTPADIRALFDEQGMTTLSEWGIVSGGIRNNWKYRVLKAGLPARLGREFLSIEVMLKAARLR